MRKVLIVRYQTNPEPNMRAAQALVEFYNHGEATIHATPFGMVSCLMTKASPETIFRKLLEANIEDKFSVIEIDDLDIPIKVMTSTESSLIELNEWVGTPEEMQIELDALLDKIQNYGQAGLTPNEVRRLRFLSNRE